MSRCRAFLLMAVISAVLGFAPSLPAQAPPALGDFAYQSHALRLLLFRMGLKPLASLTALEEESPADCIVLILGEPEGALPPEGLEAFLERGGAVLVASDHQLSRAPASRALREATGVTIDGRTFVHPFRDDDQRYKENEYFPFLQPAEGVTPNLFVGVRSGSSTPQRVATNAPSCLVLRGPLPPGIEPLAYLPGWCALERDNPEEGYKFARDPLPFAVGGERGAGRILVLADHSIFINQLMIPQELGNLAFADNCIKWLRGEKGKLRQKVLFVEDGRARTDLDVPVKYEDLKLPPNAARAIPAAINELLAEMEKRDQLNRGLQAWLGEMGLGGVVLRRWMLVIATFLLLAFLVYYVGVRGRYRQEQGVPLLARAVRRQAPRAPLMDQRRAAVLESGNLYEAARGLAREWLSSLPLPPATVNGSVPPPPDLALRGGWWRRRALCRRFGRLWRLAHAPVPVRVSRRSLRRLMNDMDELQKAMK